MQGECAKMNRLRASQRRDGNRKQRKQGTGCQEEDNDDLLESILRYNKDINDETVHFTPLIV